MISNIVLLFVLLAICLLIGITVYIIINKHLCTILDNVIKLPSCTVLYSRILLIGLLCTSIAASLGTSFDLKEDASFMEYVWRFASGLSDIFSSIFWFLVIYLIVITVIIAVLRKIK